MLISRHCCGVLNVFFNLLVAMQSLGCSGWLLGDCLLVEVKRVHPQVSVKHSALWVPVFAYISIYPFVFPCKNVFRSVKNRMKIS